MMPDFYLSGPRIRIGGCLNESATLEIVSMIIFWQGIVEDVVAIELK